jgi:hypothetical protein
MATHFDKEAMIRLGVRLDADVRRLSEEFKNRGEAAASAHMRGLQSSFGCRSSYNVKVNMHFEQLVPSYVHLTHVGSLWSALKEVLVSQDGIDVPKSRAPFLDHFLCFLEVAVSVSSTVLQSPKPSCMRGEQAKFWRFSAVVLANMTQGISHALALLRFRGADRDPLRRGLLALLRSVCEHGTRDYLLGGPGTAARVFEAEETWATLKGLLAVREATDAWGGLGLDGVAAAGEGEGEASVLDKKDNAEAEDEEVGGLSADLVRKLRELKKKQQRRRAERLVNSAGADAGLPAKSFSLVRGLIDRIRVAEPAEAPFALVHFTNGILLINGGTVEHRADRLSNTDSVTPFIHVSGVFADALFRALRQRLEKLLSDDFPEPDSLPLSGAQVRRLLYAIHEVKGSKFGLALEPPHRRIAASSAASASASGAVKRAEGSVVGKNVSLPRAASEDLDAMVELLVGYVGRWAGETHARIRDTWWQSDSGATNTDPVGLEETRTVETKPNPLVRKNIEWFARAALKQSRMPSNVAIMQDVATVAAKLQGLRWRLSEEAAEALTGVFVLCWNQQRGPHEPLRIPALATLLRALAEVRRVPKRADSELLKLVQGTLALAGAGADSDLTGSGSQSQHFCSFVATVARAAAIAVADDAEVETDATSVHSVWSPLLLEALAAARRFARPGNSCCGFLEHDKAALWKAHLYATRVLGYHTAEADVNFHELLLEGKHRDVAFTQQGGLTESSTQGHMLAHLRNPALKGELAEALKQARQKSGGGGDVAVATLVSLRVDGEVAHGETGYSYDIGITMAFSPEHARSKQGSAADDCTTVQLAIDYDGLSHFLRSKTAVGSGSGEQQKDAAAAPDARRIRVRDGRTLLKHSILEAVAAKSSDFVFCAIGAHEWQRQGRRRQWLVDFIVRKLAGFSALQLETRTDEGAQ